MKKNEITSDQKLNPSLKEEVTTLRGGIVNQANKQDLPSRFEVHPHKDAAKMIITDKETKKSVEVPLFAYGEVRRALNGLL